ncbi:MAG TPA: flagellar basal body-associated FliL family protein [Candidatus Mailhella merdigallinarum]|uniref:Flagellar protein FliL n=1 Tax=Candidatus Mailhella merdigallinarum TaxID=2838658 RepID=A0A9D2KLH0_9BACT|nr:flagellar basal body-associated FliL family protein [Desulfovibrionaceae bacterium]HJA09225.1 flagellar basal body-associated FliL family protein [Candidatus Mailhella merdigallinarum]
MPLDELEEKATPDEGTLAAGEFESLAGQKVQLDIDDAPFLLDPDDMPEVPATTESKPPAPVEEKPRRNTKKLMAAVFFILLLAGAAIWFFVFRQAPDIVAPPEPPVIVVPTPKAPTIPKEFSTKLAPFWIPLVDDEGKSRFLVATFVLSTPEDQVNQEIQDKLVTLRDAIFYYLRNKDYHFLLDAANAETIRADLLGTINNYIVRGELHSLYFDSYLLQ